MADTPIPKKFRKDMNELARLIDLYFNDPDKPPKVGFALLTAEFGKIDGGRVNYISNASRADMKAMMKEWLARDEGRYVAADKDKPQ